MHIAAQHVATIDQMAADQTARLKKDIVDRNKALDSPDHDLLASRPIGAMQQKK